MQFHAVANNAFTTVAEAIAAIDTEIVVNISSLDNVAVPFYVDAGTEVMEVTSVVSGSPDSTQSTWTVTRAIVGSAAAYAVDIPVVQRVYAQQTNEIQNALLLVQKLTTDSFGADFVAMAVGTTALEVIAKDPASMSVTVSVGTAMVSSSIVGFLTAQTVTLTAPPSGNRTDCVQLSNLNVLSVKTGSETPDANNIGLATIALTDATTTITTGIITDIRA
jgi:hypothetical protein